MKIVYLARAVPVRRADRAVIGWVRVDPLADGTKCTDMVFLRDGTTRGQAEAAKLVALDTARLYPSEGEAVRDGVERLRRAEARGELRRVPPRR